MGVDGVGDEIVETDDAMLGLALADTTTTPPITMPIPTKPMISNDLSERVIRRLIGSSLPPLKLDCLKSVGNLFCRY